MRESLNVLFFLSSTLYCAKVCKFKSFVYFFVRSKHPRCSCPLQSPERPKGAKKS